MLLTKEIEIRVTSHTIKHYRNLGYECNFGDIIIVKVEDLPPKSHAIVDVQCDYCGADLKKVYNKYVSQTDNGNLKCACKNCIKYKAKETMQKLYGVDNIFQSENFKEDMKIYCLSTYGVENFHQVEDIKKKTVRTNIERYGVPTPMQNEQIKQKVWQTVYDRYGVQYPSQSAKIREKTFESYYKNGTQKVSIQQDYLHNLYGGELNYPISHYSADICLLDDKIDIEYDGGGHNLQVKIGNITDKDFLQKEIIRFNTIKTQGYKTIKIISSKDKLPSDEILIKMLFQAKEYFNTTNHTWVEYNIDTSLMRNAEYKEGVFFDYGELRSIKRELSA